LFDNAADEKPILKESPKSYKYNKTADENLYQPQNLFQVDNENLIQPQNLFQVDNDNFNQPNDFYDAHFNKYKLQDYPMSPLSSNKSSKYENIDRVDESADEKPILKESPPKQEPKQESENNQDFVTSYLEVSEEDINKGKYKKKYINSMNKPQLTYELKNKFNIDLDQSMTNTYAKNLLINKLKDKKFVWVLNK
jgi:hypothetical protein